MDERVSFWIPACASKCIRAHFVLWMRSTRYFETFLFPSTALMPMEYCLPLMDTFDCVEDIEFVASYREFVAERTGIELIIMS